MNGTGRGGVVASPAGTTRAARVDRLVAQLERHDVEVSVDAARRGQASRDHSWLSPVLLEKVPTRSADAVCWPTTTAELGICIDAAARAEVPITLRGRGTGNYGQAVPLEAGLVIDTLRLRSRLDIGDGVAHVAAGVPCRTIEAAARRSRQELQMFPSTTSSTIGGFVAGGAGGSGSIAHGFVWDGFVAGATVLPVRPDPEPISLTEAEEGTSLSLADVVHTFGTVAVISELTVRLDPAHDWTGLAASFPTFADAYAAGTAMLHEAVSLRLLSVTEQALVVDLPPAGWLDASRASLRAVVEVGEVDAARDIAARHGGRIDAVAAALVPPITQCSFNHITLYAKQADPEICHLQVGGVDLERHADVLYGVLPEARYHADGRGGPGGPQMGGLLISKFTSEAELADASDALRSAGMHVVDPHTWAVADPTGRLAAVSAELDPSGLLNPGKLARDPALLPARGAGHERRTQ